MVSFQASAYIQKVAQSLSIALGEGTISKATMRADITATGPYTATYYLSADGGSNWEEVTLGTEHTFTNTGTDCRWKVVGSGPFQITKITVDYS